MAPRCKKRFSPEVWGCFFSNYGARIAESGFPQRSGGVSYLPMAPSCKKRHIATVVDCASKENRPLGGFFSPAAKGALPITRNWRLGWVSKAQSPLQQVAISVERLAYRNVLGGQQGSVGAFQIRGRARNGTAMLCQEIIAGG